MVPCKLLQFIIYEKTMYVANVCKSAKLQCGISLMNTDLNTQFQTTLFLSSRLVAICGLKGNTNMGVTSVMHLQNTLTDAPNISKSDH